ncbi:hypothetical protein PMAYCL1PPCAC_12056, partial [Pristionchus mayeri]
IAGSMNQAIQYTYAADPRGSGSGQQPASTLNFGHQSFHPTSTYTSTPFSHGTTSFIPGSSDYKMPGVTTSQPQSMRSLNAGAESDDRRIAALLDSYFIDTPSANWSQQQSTPSATIGQQAQQRLQTGASSSSASYSTPGGGGSGSLSVTTKGAAKMMTPEKRDKERVKRLKQAEAARLRYHRLTPDQKKDLNMKRTIAQKRKRQREKELEELESILRQTNDIQEDPEVTDQLRERRMRAKWAEAARARYQRMSSEERRAHNNKRRMRQMQNAISATKDGSLATMEISVREVLQAEGLVTGDPHKDDEVIRMHMKEQNCKKAEAARARYHRMSEEEKRQYNQRRTEAFRRRRMEEEMLLAMPIGRINGEALDRAQQIVVRNAKRAEAARLRYQRMTPDQRKQYNQVRLSKRYTPKRKRGEGSISGDISGNSSLLGGFSGGMKKAGFEEDEVDALTTLERDVMKRTAQAQQTLARTNARVSYSTPNVGSSSSSNGPTLASHLGAQLQQTSQQQSLLHQMPQQMGSYNQNLSSMGHLQPIINPYSGRP